jgi:hypothetical protein
MLTTLGPDGWATVRENPDRIRQVTDEVESMGLKVVVQYDHARGARHDAHHDVPGDLDPRLDRGAQSGLAVARYIHHIDDDRFFSSRMSSSMKSAGSTEPSERRRMRYRSSPSSFTTSTSSKPRAQR